MDCYNQVPRYRLIALFMLLAICSCPGHAAEEKVIYPRPASVSDPQTRYILTLLHLGLKNSGKSYVANSTPTRMQQAGVIREMLSNHGKVDLFWSMTTDERENELLPVRIPLDKGLIGWRIALVKVEHARIFQSVKSLGDLQAFRAGQEAAWPDAKILRSNKLPVVTATSEDAMFTMLTGGRFDYFPRSVIEIRDELDVHATLPLAIEQEIVLHYPSALYFFVSPRRPELAADLRGGMEKAVADGSFERLFQQYIQPELTALNIKQRRVIELNNPLLKSDNMPLHRRELWYRP